MKNFKLTEETKINSFGITLYRIECIKDFKNIKQMKKLILLFILIISFNINAQEKERIIVKKFIPKYRLAITKDNDSLKVMQIRDTKERKVISKAQYNRYVSEDDDNDKYVQIKTLRAKPTTLERFFTENWILEYFEHETNGKRIILAQKVGINVELK